MERNFHIFYQIIAASSLPKSEQGPLTKKYCAQFSKIKSLDEYNYTNQSPIQDIEGEDDALNLELALQCMKSVKFTDNDIIYVLQIIVAILNLGNIQFYQGDKAMVEQSSMEYMEWVKRLLQIKDIKTLDDCLTTKTIRVGNELIPENLEVEAAIQSRDTLCKNLYAELFSWIIQRVNSAISVGSAAAGARNIRK